ncbi:SWIM zinc finger family protein [Paenibacillus sp. IB182496]|uniref:SWIM zinc finger family protein n=1 Tax=Paenibacillus sabuli TaxID=2772509 RepID=A0A927GS57_9BACL|nr:SWIM zinc finger family protein [Paenibacillus sabuli]MBD2846374.1 SWIM zinc finger family protein [Paenibacillus sabuli]
MTILGNIPLHEAQWRALLLDTAARFDDLTLKRGYQLYMQGRIGALDADAAPGLVEAIAQEDADYRVRIDLDAPDESACACPAERPCKHLAAALMAYAQSRGRSVHMLANAHSAQHIAAASGDAAADNRGDRPLGVASAATGSGREDELRDQAGRLAELSIAQWQAWIAGCAARATSSPYQAHYGQEVRARVRDMAPALTDAEAWLLELNVGLYVLGKQAPGSHAGYFAHLATSETMEAIARHLEHELPPQDAAKPRGRLLETAAYLREAAMADAPSPAAYLDVYVELWIRVLAPAADGPELFEEELARLEEATKATSAATPVEGQSAAPLAEQAGQQAPADPDAADPVAYAHPRPIAPPGADGSSGPRQTDPLFPLVARAWMHVWLAEDRAAWGLLEAAERHRLKPEHVLRFLRMLEEASAWERLEAWLSECATERIGHRYGSLDEYGRYWDAVLAHRPEAESRMWSAIASLLPYASSLYADKLMRYGRYRQWIDYQLSLGSNPLDFRASDLQPIEKAEPEALLPFYHQGVENYVLLKNRHGYKRAVKLLKRLARLYKKLKREPRWTGYLDAFAARHSRLRALQEEMRKGKLIP